MECRKLVGQENHLNHVDKFDFQAGNLPEYYFDNDFPVDTKTDGLQNSVDNDDDVFVDSSSNADKNNVDKDLQNVVSDVTQDEVEEEDSADVEKAIDEKDFDK